jgi:hypothetical protein
MESWREVEKDGELKGGEEWRVGGRWRRMESLREV